MRAHSESGQATVMIIGFAVVALLMVGVAVDASAAYLRRQGLDNLADGAALAAADGVQGRQVYEGGLGERARIDPEVARGYVADYLRATGAAGRFPGLRWSVDAGTDRVVVRVAAPLELPLTLPGLEERTIVSATAASYVVVSE
jgi:putative Flp pilus-assembly TadE/G-like protein